MAVGMSVVPGLKRSDTLGIVSAFGRQQVRKQDLRSRSDRKESGAAETGDEAEEEEDAHILGCRNRDIEYRE